MIARRSGSVLMSFATAASSPSLASTSSLASSSSSGSARALFSSTASASQAPRPPRLVPQSQHLAKTPIPDSVYTQVQTYPLHPLLGFFALDTRKITRRNANGSEEDIEVAVPVAVSEGDLTRDHAASRAWLAPELRKKSSLELHQLWYACLKERNRLLTTRDELKRSGTRELARYHSLNITYVDRRVRKTMARIKFVLNERRLALIEAQERALQGIAVEEPGADMLEDAYEDADTGALQQEGEEGSRLAAAAAGEEPGAKVDDVGGSTTDKVQAR